MDPGGINWAPSIRLNSGSWNNTFLQEEKAFGKNSGKQLFCFFFFSFICKIASIKVKYLFQNSWYDSYVVSKVMSFKIKASQNFSNQLYVVFSSISGTSPKFWRIILINLPCPLSMYVFCFRVPFETRHIWEVFYDI